jgi:hypothetical protein
MGIAMTKEEVEGCMVAGGEKKRRRGDRAGERRRWRMRHPDLNLAQSQRYRERHPEVLKAATSKWKKSNKDKVAAHKAVSRSVRRGVTPRGACVVCGCPGAEGHHEDYADRLGVTWLCHTHHMMLHRGKLCLLSQRPTLTTTAPLPV